MRILWRRQGRQHRYQEMGTSSMQQRVQEISRRAIPRTGTQALWTGIVLAGLLALVLGATLRAQADVPSAVTNLAGKAAPSFTLPAERDAQLLPQPVSFSPGAGHPTVLVFFFTLCTHCLLETKTLHDLAATYSSSGLQLIYIDSYWRISQHRRHLCQATRRLHADTARRRWTCGRALRRPLFSHRPLRGCPWRYHAANRVGEVSDAQLQADFAALLGNQGKSAVAVAHADDGKQDQPRLILILGGARSGKSDYAEALAARIASGHPVLYVATATAEDDEMRARIERHRAARPLHWRTAERRATLPPRSASSPRVTISRILLDCMTLLVSNLLLDGTHADFDEQRFEASVAEARATTAIAALLAAWRETRATLILVSNEVGMGLVPPYPLGRVYRDVLGRINAGLAREADAVLLMVAGLPVELKSLSAAWQARGNTPLRAGRIGVISENSYPHVVSRYREVDCVRRPRPATAPQACSSRAYRRPSRWWCPSSAASYAARLDSRRTRRRRPTSLPGEDVVERLHVVDLLVVVWRGLASRRV